MNSLLNYNELKKPFQSCTERNVPVMELGSNFAQNCIPAINNLKKLKESEIKFHILDESIKSSWKRMESLLEGKCKSLEHT